VGGRDYIDSQYNRATQARRQPGSVFKLFVYLAALRDGMALEDTVLDAPLDADRDWRPANHDDRYAGRGIALREAFARSSNVAAVRLAEEVGPGAVVRAARDLGIDSELEAEPSIALGTSEVGLLELVAAFASVPTGARVEPTGLPRDGEPDFEALDLPVGQREQLLDLLWSSANEGTGRAARIGALPVFGKTGTTQDHRDAWFVGLAGDVAVGVWVGNDDNAPMDRVTGGGLPAQVWRDVAREAVRGRESGGRQADAATAPAPADAATAPRNPGESAPATRRGPPPHAKAKAKGNGNGKGRGRGRGPR